MRFLASILTMFIGAILALILMELLAGCGETYVDAAGIRHRYECVFIPNPR